MPRTPKVLTTDQMRMAEHKAFLRALNTMSKLALKQAEVMGSFMKSYEVASPPEARVLSDERELFYEQEEQAALKRDMEQRTVLPNPFDDLG